MVFSDLTERNAEVLLHACKYIGLAANTGKTKYMEIGRNRGMITNDHIKIGSKSYENIQIFMLFSDKSKFYPRGNKM